MATDLPSELRAIRWAKNVDTFCATPQAPERVDACLRRLAIWARQLEIADQNNPALCFVREAQVQGHHIAALLGVALYKPAAGAMRALVESALYYSFYRSHPKELGTLVRDPRYFLQKAELIEFHKQHTPRFGELQELLGLVSRLNDWYKAVSGIVHGQLPGTWVNHSKLSGLAHDSKVLDEALSMLEEAIRIVHELLLVTVAPDLWHDVAKEARKELLRGLPGDMKQALGLTIA